MSKTILTADSTFDMPLEMANELGIEVIPSYVTMDGVTCDDYPELQQETLFDYYERTRTLPRTAAANPDNYIEFFSKYAKDGSAVVHIAKSSETSSCYQNAVIAANSLQNVFVFDSKSISAGSAMTAFLAAKLRDTMPAEELVKRMTEYRDRIYGSFIIEHLQYLHSGGRCSSIALLGANALKLHPCVVFRDGKMCVDRKYQGSFKRCMFNYIDKSLENIEAYDDSSIFVAHTVLDEELVESARKHIENKGYFKKIIVWKAGAAVSVHCGPNTFGMFYVNKPDGEYGEK